MCDCDGYITFGYFVGFFFIYISRLFAYIEWYNIYIYKCLYCCVVAKRTHAIFTSHFWYTIYFLFYNTFIKMVNFFLRWFDAISLSLIFYFSFAFQFYCVWALFKFIFKNISSARPPIYIQLSMMLKTILPLTFPLTFIHSVRNKWILEFWKYFFASQQQNVVLARLFFFLNLYVFDIGNELLLFLLCIN